MRRSWRCMPMILLALMSSHAMAQDIPGLENCMAEKQIERRTGCFQSNDDFLQRTQLKQARDLQARIAAAQAEIAALKSAMEKMNAELAQLKAKLESAAKK
jgi:hypothetical protein